jgi:hypothetical protein
MTPKLLKTTTLSSTFILLVFFSFFAFAVDISAQLNVESEKEAKKWIGTRFFTHSNDDTFSRRTIKDFYSSATRYDYYQINNFRFSVLKNELTKRDILNGVEWFGKLRLEAEAHRELYHFSSPFQWQEWRNTVIFEVVFKKKRGTWRFDEVGSLSQAWFGDSVPSQEEIEKLLKLPMNDS